MPSQKANQPVNNFVKGLITEASPLSYPENASLDEVNFRLCRDGSREKRLGMQHLFNVNTSLSKQQLETAQGRTYKWNYAQEKGHKVIGVVQIAHLLYFVDLHGRVIPRGLTDPIPLLNGGNAVDLGLDGSYKFDFATINGYLLIISEGNPNPYLMAYNEDTDEVFYGTSRLKIRDHYGVEDNLGSNERPKVLTDLHKYNLRNQGWTELVKTTGNPGEDVIDYVFRMGAAYPSNSDQWGVGRINDLTNADVYLFDSAIAYRNQVDIGLVPKGHYIIDLYDRGLDRHTFTGLTLPLDRDTGYASTVASYAGRAWYSGFSGITEGSDSKSPRLSNAVVYSQVFADYMSVVKCHSEADPTSYEVNEVIDTDGGILHIPECSGIKRLYTLRHSLFVFAENGVWEIRGSQQQGFTATSFEVRKINSFGISAKHSVVDDGQAIYYWAYSGIYSMVPDPNLEAGYVTTNITQTTIQTKYNSFETFAKKSAVGIYDPYNNKIRWLFHEGVNTGTYYSVAECNHSPQLAYLDNTVFLVVKKDGISPDYSTTYLYSIRVDPITNVPSITNRYTLVYALPGAVNAHTIIYGANPTPGANDYLYYFYKEGYGTTNLKVMKMQFSYSQDNITFVGSPVVLNSSCTNVDIHIQAAMFSSTVYVVAFYNATNDITLQVVKDDLTYGALTTVGTTTGTNTALYSIISLSSTKGIVAYRTSTNTIKLDYFTISGTSITINSSTTFINTTQIPTGTNVCSNISMVKLTGSKVLVTCKLSNSTLGYTDVMAAFIVTISGSTLTSNTILVMTTETGSVPICSNNYGDPSYNGGTALVVYEKTVSGNNQLNYIKLNTSGTTPVLTTSGVMMPVGSAFTSSHVHKEIWLDNDTVLSSFRDVGSLGLGSSAVYVMDV